VDFSGRLKASKTAKAGYKTTDFEAGLFFTYKDVDV
jgi:hypothetical protein